MRTLVVILSVISLAACKEKPKTQPATGSGSAGSAVAETGSGSGSAGSATEPGPAPLVLPKGDGTPPKKTTAKIDQAKVTELAKLEFPGFKTDVRRTDGGLEVRHSTPRPKISINVLVVPCFDCLPMELDKWKAKEDSLKQLLPESLRTLKDTIWEVGATDLHGAPLIYTYHLGHNFSKDDQGNPTGEYGSAYALYHNDGINQIRVVANYADNPVTREDLAAMANKNDLGILAKAFLDAYTHAW